ncbi:MAG: M23 family metallopeptidase [Lapillicoccus sp.]
MAITVVALTVGVLMTASSSAGAVVVGAADSKPPASAEPKVITALTASVVGVPEPFRGSDGRLHIDYDLLLTNSLTAPVTVTSVEVSTLDGRPLLQMTADDVAAKTLPVGATAPSGSIAGSTAAATLVDVVVPLGTKVTELVHRVGYVLPPDLPPPLRALYVSTRLVTAPVPVATGSAQVIAPPLTGPGWFSVNGCCQPSPHRSTSLSVNGAWVKPEMYAIDWIQADGQGRVCTGDCASNDLWASFGAPLLAVANGTVVRASDGAPDIPPLVSANPQTRDEFGGNSVVVQIGPRAFAFYGHLVDGSVAVKVGDRVKTGQVLGKLGNSGNTTGPHLHFDLLAGPDVLLDRSIPYEIDRFELAGSGTVSEDGLLTVTGPSARLDRDHPLIHSVSDFR